MFKKNSKRKRNFHQRKEKMSSLKKINGTLQNVKVPGIG
jgi:hypothetical protein